MKSIKEKSEELSIAFRKEQGDVGYSEQLSYKLGIEAGANYVIDVITGVLNQPMNDYLMLKEVWNTIRELKNRFI